MSRLPITAALALALALAGADGLEARPRWDPGCNCWLDGAAPAEPEDMGTEEPECPEDPIATAVEGMEEHPGFITLWVGEEEEIYAEIPAEMLGRMMLAVGTMARGDGMFTLLNMPMGDQAMEFRLNADNERIDIVYPQLALRLGDDSPLAEAFSKGTWDGSVIQSFEPLAVRPKPADDLPEGCMAEEESVDAEDADGEEADEPASEPPAMAAWPLAPGAALRLVRTEGDAPASVEVPADPITGVWEGEMENPQWGGEASPFELRLSLDGETVTGTMGGDAMMGPMPKFKGTFDGAALSLSMRQAEYGVVMTMGFAMDLVSDDHLQGTWTMSVSGEGMEETMEGPAEAHRTSTEVGGGEDISDADAYLLDVTDWVFSGMGSGAPYDPERTRIVSLDAYPENIEVEIETASPGVPFFLFGGGPTTLPDTSVLPMGLHFSLALLPEQPMTGRISDDRVGYFTTDYLDLGVETSDGGVVRLAHRWRLEKADPEAEVSDPVEPIKYHVDPTVPERWRPYVAEGIELWNKAFEAAGFTNAVRAVLPGDEDWPEDYAVGDVRYSSVSWAPSVGAVFAIGPSNVDPRSGEILNADVVFTHGWIQAWTQDFELEGSPLLEAPDPEAEKARWASFMALPAEVRGRYCVVMDPALGGDFSPSLMRLALLADGVMAPGEEIPEEFVGQGLVEVTMHEIGHTLGLRHNFRASAEIPWERLNDTAYTAEHGLVASVMDYAPANIHSDRENQGDYYSRTVGAYDVWAVAYGYTPLEAEVTGEQHPWLAAHAARGTEHGHAYGTDEDSAAAFGWDPYTNYFDLSGDPVAFYSDRLALAESLRGEMADRTVSEGESWEDHLGGVLTLMFEVYRGGTYLSKYIGGHEMSRAHRGDPDAPEPITPVSTAEQRRALEVITEILAGEAMVPSPEDYPFMVRTFWAWGWDSRGFGGLNYDVHQAVRDRRRAILSTLFDTERLGRVRDNAWLAESRGEDAFTVAELVGTVTEAVWGGEPGARHASSTFARDLQIDYVSFLLASLSSWAGDTPDLEVLALSTLLEISAGAQAALDAGGLDAMTEAHYRATVAKVDSAVRHISMR